MPAASKLSVILNPNLTSDTTTNLTVTCDALFYTKTIVCEFVTTPAAGKITIGATLNDTKTNAINYVYSQLSDFDSVTLDLSTFSVTFSELCAFTYDAKYFLDEQVAGQQKYILARSPYHVVVKPVGYAFDAVRMELRLWRGDIATDRPADAKYTLYKNIIRTGQTAIDVPINEFVRDEIRVSFDSNTIPMIPFVIESDLAYSVWCEAKITLVNSGVDILTAYRTYLGFDGYGNHENLKNPQPDININAISNGVIYGNTTINFINKDNISFLFYINDSPIDVLSFGALENSNHNVIKANIGSYISQFSLVDGDKIDVKYQIGTNDPIQLYSAIVKCADKYTLYHLIFKNRFGFWELIPFPMRNKVSLKSESTKFSPVITSNGTYSINNHARRTFNPKGTKTITLNTDYLPEDYNNAFEQLMLSEFVYLSDGTTTLPVNVVTDSLTFKQKTFDKLIQYTIDVELAYNVINQMY